MLTPPATLASTNDSLGHAAYWVEQLLFGRLGTAIAVIAVGMVGIRMLLGYSNPREMLRVLAGCFILFGAPALAHAFVQVAQSSYAPVPA